MMSRQAEKWKSRQKRGLWLTGTASLGAALLEYGVVHRYCGSLYGGCGAADAAKALAVPELAAVERHVGSSNPEHGAAVAEADGSAEEAAAGGEAAANGHNAAPLQGRAGQKRQGGELQCPSAADQEMSRPQERVDDAGAGRHSVRGTGVGPRLQRAAALDGDGPRDHELPHRRQVDVRCEDHPGDCGICERVCQRSGRAGRDRAEACRRRGLPPWGRWGPSDI